MKAGNNKVVTFDYILKDAKGEVMESSEKSGPMAYLQGAGNIIPGLERAIEGKSEGDELKVTVEPADAYGEHNEGMVQRVPIKRLGGGKFHAGQVLRLDTEQGPRVVRVLKVGRFNVDLDGNHPLAGQTLNFEVTVREIRDATEEEKQHGHVHGPGGHNHE
jgi:FKBP-type peptidyl-prolyl cis-trans isomerase SlyD